MSLCLLWFYVDTVFHLGSNTPKARKMAVKTVCEGTALLPWPWPDLCHLQHMPQSSDHSELWTVQRLLANHLK